jgi:hypothetical protein
VKVAAHVNICHDDGPAAQHDVWFAFDFCLARDFVSSILSAMLSRLLSESSPPRDKHMNPIMDTFMEENIPIHRLRVLDGKDAARTYRLNVFRLCRLARHWRWSGRHGCSSLLLLIAARVYHTLHVNSLSTRRPKSHSAFNAGCCCSQHEVSFLALVTSAGS